ncbi:MAG TPA: SRPBCC family protein [Kofleriaceae bacterium]|nr:SRPBCC family protein [Kofleriaceae bacterium]
MDLDIRNPNRGREERGANPPAAAPAPAPASAEPHAKDLGKRPNVEVTQDAMRGVRAAQGMAWFSIGLGLTQLLAPRAVSRLIGVKHGRGTIMRLFGLRELVSGLGLLSQRRAAAWTGARVVGDVLDLAAIGAAMVRPGNDRVRLAAAAGAVVAATALDLQATGHLAGDVARQEQVAQVTHVGKAITIDAPARALYDFWRDLRNLSRIMDHVLEVEELPGGRTQWTGEGPRGTTIRWEAELVEDRPGELISWRTIGGPFESSGSVRFFVAPGGRGTEVCVDMHYRLLGRVAGKLIALATGREPGLELARGLRVLKQLFELGEPMRSDASIHRGMHPARPPAPGEELRLDGEARLEPAPAPAPATGGAS